MCFSQFASSWIVGRHSSIWASWWLRPPYLWLFVCCHWFFVPAWWPLTKISNKNPHGNPVKSIPSHELSTFFFWNPKIPHGSHGIPQFRSNLRDPNTNQAPATTTSTSKPVRPRVSLPGGPTLKRKRWDSWDMNHLVGIFLIYKFDWEIYFVIIYTFVWDIIGIWLDMIYIYIWCNGICHEIWWHLESENGVYQETRTFLNWG